MVVPCSCTKCFLTHLLHRVLPGGQHADKLTSNALVVLIDGIYIEIIAFDHPVSYYTSQSEKDKRENHWWANKTPGWIDWSNLGTDVQLGKSINDRATLSKAEGEEHRVVYQEPKEGGRLVPDGRELKWRVTFPDLKHGRGTLPFFCEDITPRAWRVSLLFSIRSDPKALTANLTALG